LNNVILFSNGCPRCKVLKQKLDDKQIKYTINEDFDELIENGLQTAPVLKVDDNYYQFGEAVKFIGEWNEN
jgi:glutaredoxin